jgi:hypothetical protein
MQRFAGNFIRSLSVCAAVCLAATAFSASAAEGDDADTPAKGGVVDCSKATHPKRCEAFKVAFAACKDKPAGPERRACIKANMPAKGDAPKS